MSTTPLSTTPGTVSSHGHVVLGVKAAQTNDATHVQLDPDAGRLLLRHPVTGDTYGSVASCTSGNTALIKEF